MKLYTVVDERNYGEEVKKVFISLTQAEQYISTHVCGKYMSITERGCMDYSDE